MTTNQTQETVLQPELARVDTYARIPADQGFDSLIAAGERFEARKTDYAGRPGTFNWRGGKLEHDQDTLFGKAHASLTITPWAFEQVCGRLGKALFGEGSGKNLDKDDWAALKQNFTGHFDQVFNTLMETLDSQNGNDLLVRAYRQPTIAGDMDICRAVLTEKYAPVSSVNLMRAMWDGLRPEFEAGHIPDLRVNKSSITPDDMNLYITFKNPDEVNGKPTGGNYGMGVFISNGEIGNRSLQVNGLIQRHSCSNSILISTDFNMRMRHLGNAQSLQTMLIAAAFTIMPVSAEALDKVLEAERRALPSFSDVLAGLGKTYGWSDEINRAVAIGTEGQETVMGVVNGVSYAAHKATSNPNDQADMELLAGKLLVADDSLFARAAKLVRQEA